MVLDISAQPITVIENGVYHFGLRNYPKIAHFEVKRLHDFLKYEKLHGRHTSVVCEDPYVMSVIRNLEVNLDTAKYECAENPFVYHATDLDAAQKILSGGKLLSAVNVYGKTGAELAFEKRGSPWNDPPDYFEYIMFTWGNNPTGDYVVLSENMPSAEDMEAGNFNPGVRFYFRYDDILCHPGHVFDGYHAIKVRDELKLPVYLYACVVPSQYQDQLACRVLPELMPKVHFLIQDGIGVAEWNHVVYDFICGL